MNMQRTTANPLHTVHILFKDELGKLSSRPPLQFIHSLNRKQTKMQDFPLMKIYRLSLKQNTQLKLI